jgi:predicted nucleic acid-binding protein
VDRPGSFDAYRSSRGTSAPLLSMTFLDTGVLVSAVLQEHSEHAGCVAAVEDCERPFTDAHSLAETFATLTGFYKVPVEAAIELTLGLQDYVEVEAVALADYQSSIREAKARGVMGGGIYDSIHGAFARRKKAVRIVTRNPSHFQHVAPDIEILTP